MSHARTQTLIIAALCCTILLAGCASREVLAPYSPANVVNVDLSGQWELQGDPVRMERRIQDAIRRTDDVSDGLIVPRRSSQTRRSAASQRVSGGLVHVFFENGRSLKITQTPSALFISFDRAVVEEYRFGENREISVGQATAQRVSGWDGGEYVVETLGRNGMKLSERYALSADGQELTRRVVFRSKQHESVEIVQTFERG